MRRIAVLVVLLWLLAATPVSALSAGYYRVHWSVFGDHCSFAFKLIRPDGTLIHIARRDDVDAYAVGTRKVWLSRGEYRSRVTGTCSQWSYAIRRA